MRSIRHRLPVPLSRHSWVVPTFTNILARQCYLELLTHSQISTSAPSYPGVLEWDITGSTEKNSSSLGDFTLALTDRHTVASSMFMAAQYDKTSDANNMVPLYPSLSARLAQGTPSQIPNQGHSRLSLPYREGSQVGRWQAAMPLIWNLRWCSLSKAGRKRWI